MKKFPLLLLTFLCGAYSQDSFAMRDWYNYELKNGHSIVYRGQTNNPKRRCAEHLRDGKKFTHMRVIGYAKTRKGALKRERRDLAKYRRSHGGKNPKYNQTDHG